MVNLRFWESKQAQVVLFSSCSIALYGYDQGMMSLVNTNHDYLQTMGIETSSPLVGVIVSVYYIGCAIGAVIASYSADQHGRKPSIFACLVAASVGNLMCFVAGMKGMKGALELMMAGRVIMGLGIGGIDSVIPIFSSELSEDDERGKALAQEFQFNILGLNLAFAINLALTVLLGKTNQWAWRVPIVAMQVFPLTLLAVIARLPESPRFHVFHGQHDKAMTALKAVYPDEDEAEQRLKELDETHKEEEENGDISYWDMLTPGHLQFHPTVLTIMGQINQALTGYGAVSVYGPQIFQLLGFSEMMSEYITQANFVSYFFLMTLAWILIDWLGRRKLMLWNSAGLVICFALLGIVGGLAVHSDKVNVPELAVSITGTVLLFVATGNFGVGWLATVWLIPTEIYPTGARAKGTAISVIVWGIANFIITLVTPIMFTNLKYWLFFVFAATNTFAGVWTWAYLPETGGRSFRENQVFFEDAREEGSWRVRRVERGKYKRMPNDEGQEGGEAQGAGQGERTPLLR